MFRGPTREYPEANAIAKRIEDCFFLEPMPGGIFREHEMPRYLLLTMPDGIRGLSWRALLDQRLAGEELVWMSGAGLDYYLPAYLLASTDPHRAQMEIHYLLQALDPLHMRASFNERCSVLRRNPEHLAVVLDVLRFIARWVAEDRRRASELLRHWDPDAEAVSP